MKRQLAKMLGADGVFAAELVGFRPRKQQLALAQAIGEAIEQQGTLIAEAGTGTGKTFAYLLPALLSGKKVIISTGTKTLQDQLFAKDLPKILELLGIKRKVRLLKGRNNYLCPSRYHKACLQPISKLPVNRQLFKALPAWIEHTQSGEIAELAALIKDRSIVPYITSTKDNCLCGEDDFYGECFVTRARRRALRADVLVINHHLLFADMAIKQQGFGELLPKADLIVLDESHQVPDVAGQFFSETFSSRMISDLVNDLTAEAAEVDAAYAAISTALEDFKHANRDVLLQLCRQPQKGSQQDLFAAAVTEELFDFWLYRQGLLLAALEPLVTQSSGLQNVYLRLAALGDLLNEMMNQADKNYVYWYESYDKYFALHKSPLEIAEPFSQFRNGLDSAWVLTSATLTVNRSFEHFQRQTGLDSAQTMLLDSPFDYQRQALLLLPQTLPEPNQPNFNQAMFDYVLPIINQVKGGVFFLFTTHRSLQMAADFFAHHCQRPLFVQGQQGRNTMLENFRQAGNGLLLGAASFWEGVDVAGSGLSCVIIDKLPFAHPDDPVLKAKIKHINSNGGRAFFDHQIPQAIISLKQGAGRLIRGEDDRGLLVICDRRVVSKGYGQQFLKSLPDFKVTQDQNQALQFLQQG